MTKKNLLLSVMTLFVTNAHACFMYDVEGTPQPVNNVDPSKSNGPIKKAPARRLINVYVNTCTDELLLSYANGSAPLTYYIYDENMHPVMCGRGVFDERGLFVISMDTLLSGEYSIEICVNGSIYNNSFYKY